MNKLKEILYTGIYDGMSIETLNILEGTIREWAKRSVSDQMVRRTDHTNDYGKGHIDGFNSCRDRTIKNIEEK